jgi:NAD(P)H-hydrate epimerase
MKVFTAQQMRDFDRAATDEYSIPSIVLMENAALRVVEFLEMKFAPLQDKKIIVLCGKGNNGGDGFAIARHLAAIDGFSWVFLAASPDDLKGDARTNFLALQQCPFPITEFGPKVALSDLAVPADRATNYIIVDALLGSGFRGEIEDERHISMLASLAVTNETVVAVDLPSGLNADDWTCGAACSTRRLHGYVCGSQARHVFGQRSRNVWRNLGRRHRHLCRLDDRRGNRL